MLLSLMVGLVGYLMTDRVWRWSVALRYRRRRESRPA